MKTSWIAFLFLVVSLTACASGPQYGRRTFPVDLHSNPEGARLYVLKRTAWDTQFPDWRDDFPEEMKLAENGVSDEDGVAPVEGVRLPPYRFVLVGYWDGGEHGITFFTPAREGNSFTVLPLAETHKP